MKFGFVLAALSLGGPWTPVTRSIAAPIPVHTRTVCPDGRGTRQMEPAAAILDSVIVVSFNDTRGICPTSGYQVAGWSYSLDGGATFQEGATLPSATRWSFDQWLQVGPDGAFYHSALSAEGSRHGVILNRGVVSAGTIEWSEPIVYVPDVGSCDKPGLAIDPVSGTIYIAYTVFAGDMNPASGLWLLRSSDGGQSFMTPIKVASNSATSGSNAAFPLVLSDGSLALAWKSGRNVDPTVTIYYARSTDGGETFSAPSVVATACTFNVPGTDGSPIFPQLAVDLDSGALYLAWQTACPDEGPATSGAIVAVRSTDAGASWTSPVLAIGGSGPEMHVQPTLAVDRFGRPCLVAYRAIASGDTSIATLVYTQSNDGGAHFEPVLEITDMPSTWGVTPEPGPENYGEYITAVTTADGIGVAYCDARSMDPDVYWAGIPTTMPTGAPATSAAAGDFLDPIVPNPSAGEARVRFGLGRRATISLAIYDVGGRVVRGLDRGAREPGDHTVRWDLRDERARRVAPGVYFARLYGVAKPLTRFVVVTK